MKIMQQFLQNFINLHAKLPHWYKYQGVGSARTLNLRPIHQKVMDNWGKVHNRLGSSCIGINK